MEREEVLAEPGRALEAGEEMGEEVVGVRSTGVRGWGRGLQGSGVRFTPRSVDGVVAENDDFVDAEDGEGAGDLAD